MERGEHSSRSCNMAMNPCPAAVTLVFFSREVMLAWTHNPLVADNTHLVVSLLVIGTALNGLSSVSGYLQFAAGWPQLMMYTNLAATSLLAPLIYVLAKFYGASERPRP